MKNRMVMIMMVYSVHPPKVCDDGGKGVGFFCPPKIQPQVWFFKSGVAILLILVMMLMLRRRMGFIMIKYCKFSDDFDWFFQLQHDSWWDSLVCRGDINCQIMLSHRTSNNHDQSRLFLQNISRWFWGQRTDSESLFHRGCSEVENIFSWCFNKNNFS